jgi:hypothetical protein
MIPRVPVTVAATRCARNRHARHGALRAAARERDGELPAPRRGRREYRHNRDRAQQAERWRAAVRLEAILSKTAHLGDCGPDSHHDRAPANSISSRTLTSIFARPKTPGAHQLNGFARSAVGEGRSISNSLSVIAIMPPP